MRCNRPNLFIAGYPKCGTSSLWVYLNNHPLISGGRVKEPGDWRGLTCFSGNRTKYLANFVDCPEDIEYVMDGTPGYMLNDFAATSLRRFSPDAKVIIGIREPLSYLESMCFQIEKNTGQRRSLIEDFKRQMPYTQINYSRRIENMRSVFGCDNTYIYIYIFDDFCSNNQHTLNAIFRFLSLEELSTENSEIVLKENVSKEPNGSFFEFLLKSPLCATFRSSVIGLLDFSPGVKASIQRMVWRRPKHYANELTVDFAEAIRSYYKNDVIKTSALIGRDLVKHWDYA